MNKVCSKCKQDLEDNAFAKDSSKKSGLSSQCNECKKSYATKWRNENKSKTKDWRVKNSDHLKAYNKQYKEDNKEVQNAKNKEWRENNQEHLKEYNAQTGRIKNNPVYRNKTDSDGKITEKHCPSCQQYLYIKKFHKDKTTTDGYYSFCIECKNIKRQGYKNAN